jgi:hypothetical protein
MVSEAYSLALISFILDQFREGVHAEPRGD